MIEFWIKRHGAELHPATPTDFEHFKELPEGVSVKVKAGNGRSSKHHRLFFGAIFKAFMNWPESHEFQPQNDEHLRAWLLCKAKYCTCVLHTIDHKDAIAWAMNFALKELVSDDGYKFLRWSEKQVAVYRPKSIAWGKLPQDEFNKISQSVSDILKAEINMSLDDFKNQEAA